MLKPLTLSLSLAVALGLGSVSKAGGLMHGSTGGCTTCGIASPQGPVVSPQAPMPSVQCEAPVACTIAKPKCSLLSNMGTKMSCMKHDMSANFASLCAKLKPKPKCYTYEWVLKKKRVWGGCGGCGAPTCETCTVAPSPQVAPSGQVAPAPQAIGGGSPQAYYGAGSSGQIASAAGYIAPAPAPVVGGDEAPPAPEVAPVVGPQSSLLFSTPSGN